MSISGVGAGYSEWREIRKAQKNNSGDNRQNKQQARFVSIISTYPKSQIFPPIIFPLVSFHLEPS